MFTIKHHKGFIALACLSLFVLALYTSPKVLADPGGRTWSCGYFDNKCFTPSGNNLYTPVIPNGIPSSARSKSGFISYIESLLSSGNAQEQTGAAFLINLMLGQAAPGYGRSPSAADIQTWQDNINQSSITLSVVTSQDYLGWNSGYQNIYHPSSNTFNLFDNDDAFYPTSGSAPALDFYYKGNLVFIVKLSCGNPLGDFPQGLPQAPKIHKPAGKIVNSSCTSVEVFAKDSNYPNETLDVQITLATSSKSSTLQSQANHYHTFVTPSWVQNMTTKNTVTVSYYIRDPNNPANPTGWAFNGRVTIQEPCKTTNNPPTGSLIVACTSSTAGKATGTFSDPDGPTSALIKVAGISYATATFSPHTWYGIPIPNSGSTSVTLYVKDVGPKGTNTYQLVASATLTNTNCISKGPNCNGQNTKPTINLPPGTTPAPSGSSQGPSGQGGASNTANEKYYQEVGGDYEITAAHDQYTPSPTTITWSPTGYQSSNSFVLDYSNYVSQYPYDDHQTTVTYNQKYTQTYWYTSSSPDYYTCPYGGSLSVSTCTYNANSYYSCPYNEYLGSSPNNTKCYYYSNNAYAGPATLVYYCPYGNLNGKTCTYTATAWYDWHQGSTTNPSPIDTTYNGSPLLNECYNRNFAVQNPSATDVTNITFDNNENPSQVTIGTQTTVQFSLTLAPSGALGVRHPARVNGLQYTGTYYVRHANGSLIPFYAQPTDSQQFNIGSASPTPGSPAEAPPYVYNPSYSVSVPPLEVGDEICAQFTIYPQGDQVDENGNIQQSNGLTVTSTPVTATSLSNCSSPITNEPYAHFFGGDVSAGGGFTSLSSCNSAGDIKTNIKSSGPPASGSAVQLGALSINAISGFASASLRTTDPTSATGLSFGNYGVPGSYGGSLGGQHCIPDYYATLPPGTPLSGNINGIDVQSSGSRAYSFNGNQSLNRSLALGNGAEVSVYVNGNVEISQNIVLANTSWGSLSQVPSFFLIVKGNIYIDPGVTQLDGVYVAEGTGSTGIIDTCANGFSSYPISVLYNACGPSAANNYTNTQLTINGAFIANNVKLDRAFSSLRHSVAGENPNAGSSPHDCDVQNGSSTTPELDCAAEIFNFSPETYLGLPDMTPFAGPGKNKYDYFTSLSPVL
ncbi:MAG TPA: hypothetical protein VNE40_04575 [Candidatus Dormibacteraeota bacterium]|nr:hypothetical protein [Candidatus Dormibacteraeota bacterium]